MTAFTNPIDPRTGEATAYPAYINVRFEDDNAVVILRGDPVVDAGSGTVSEAPTTQATFTRSDWEQFQTWVIRDSGLPGN